ncbi:hypothetical protein L5876_14685, partial [Hyphobacterium sp. SN044]|uniref:hypothetical protein n=1 Tax=Hyphobacterium sp. SN044 TaxID=2912575 RepID=UPI001F253016
MSAWGILMCLLLASAASAQDTATVAPVPDKVSPGVQQALAQGATMLPLFIELQDQPQAEILQRMEAETPRLAVAKSTFEKL